MLLTALKAYADSLPEADRTPPMYDHQRIRYFVDLTSDGRFLSLVDAATSTKGPEARGPLMVAPKVARTSAPRANLLMDTAEYALGVPRTPERVNDAPKRHALFVANVAECAQATDNPAVQAVLAFLQGVEQAGFQPPEGFDPSQNVTFRVDGFFVIDEPAVQQHWAQKQGAGGTDEAEAETGDVLECLLCGQQRPALRRIPFKVKNVPNGQTSGTALISANARAFESYGLEESLIAPICHGCAEAFSKGLGALIAGDATHLRRDPLLYVFWTRGAAEFSPVPLLEEPTPDQVRVLLRAPDTGRPGAAALDDTQFYAASLTGSGGRVAVRDWLDITVSEARANLARFFHLQAVVDTDQPDDPRPFAAWFLARATVRPGGNDAPLPETSRAIYRVALAGGPVPLSILFNVVRRFRAEHFDAPRSITRARIALVKLVLLSQPTSPWKETDMVALDREEVRPAYLCGRLLAVLEAAQEAAIRGANATIVDRFYGAASSTPIAVFGRLLRGAQPHLAKLRRDQPGVHVSLQNEIQTILGALPVRAGQPAFPATLNLQDQGLFALGYYHQRAERFRRRTAEPSASTTDPSTDAQ